MNIVLFLNNLRLHDNQCIRHAQQQEKKWKAVYINDTRQDQRYHGINRRGELRKQWLTKAVNHFKTNLKRHLDKDLLIKHGHLTEELKKLTDKHDIDEIITDVHPGLDERQALKNLNTPITWKYDTWLWNPNDHDKPIENTPDVFGNFRRYVENNSHVRTPTTLKEKETLAPQPSFIHHEHTSIPFNPGERAALHRLQRYVWDKKLPKKYKYTRNQLQGKNFSTKFSLWLAHGTLSPRHIYHEIEKFEDQYGSSKSTYWIKFELTWRDFFRYQALKHDKYLFAPGGIEQKNIPWKDDGERLKRFKNARTGYPLIDAGMKELQQTGWMSNRVRQNVASFFTKNLHLDWRIGAAIFERYLLDYDVASNYGNWQYNASIGNDGRGYRYFNVIKQGKKYDAEDYITTWLPELAGLQKQHIHQPWLMSEGEQEMYDFSYGTDYPRRIVDFDASRKESEDWFNP